MWQSWSGVIIATLLGVPVAAFVVWALVARGRPVRHALSEVGMVFGTAPWIWMVLTPNHGVGAGHAGSSSGSSRVSLSLMHDLTFLFGTTPTAFLVNLIGNLAVFFAVGVFAPVRFAALARLSRVLALAAVLSVLAESAQWMLDLGRVSSIDDVLVNTVGAGLGALLSRPWWATTRDSPAIDVGYEAASAP